MLRDQGRVVVFVFVQKRSNAIAMIVKVVLVGCARMKWVCIGGGEMVVRSKEGSLFDTHGRTNLLVGLSEHAHVACGDQKSAQACGQICHLEGPR